jgi:hypothetical protein
MMTLRRTVLVLPLLLLAVLAAACQPHTILHYTSNGNFSGSTYTPGVDRFNLADVNSVGMANSLPSGVKGLVYIGQCGGVTQSFTNAVNPFIGNARVFGFYLMDEPDPTGRYSALCPPANLKAESDYIHFFFGSAKTFIIEMNLGASSAPTYAGGYTPGNSDIDLYGLDPYPCRSELNGCNDNIITLGVKAAESAGIPEADIVPVYQAFGGGTYTDDGGGQWIVPTAAQETAILNTWGPLVPTPVFDYAYSWGSQRYDQSLQGSTLLQQVFASHNS